MRKFLWALLIAIPLSAQVTNPPKYLQGTTVSKLPSASATSALHQIWAIYDGTSVTDCTVGGGSTKVLCTSNGSVWAAYGGGGGGTTTNPLTMNNSGSGAASGTIFDGSAARTISYNTIGAAASGNAFVFVTTQTVTGSPAATISFTSIAGTAKNLLLKCNGQTSSIDKVGINFNSDTTAAHYAATRITTSSGTMITNAFTTDAFGFLIFGQSSKTVSFTTFIHDYTNTTFATKNAESMGMRFDAGTSAPVPEDSRVQFTPASAGAITQIDLTEEGPGTFAVGTTCTLYGLPG